jgi:GNAT superfamily N-acetyltransferase
MENIIIRQSKAGEMSYVSYLQMKYYESAYGFKRIFEYYLLISMAEFIRNPNGGQLWVAADGDEIIGSMAAVRVNEHTAQLRWFVVADGYQGKGIGNRLMDTALQFCRSHGYKYAFLWTAGMLDPARHLYGKYGFKLTKEKSNTEWTAELLTEERWDLML